MSESGGNGEELRDALVKDYGTALRESALLTTFSGFLFGFLLNISISSARQFTFSYRIIILIALFNIMVAMCLFIMPVIYHHIEFPYKDVRKFIRRSHRFILFGFLPTAMSLYLGMVLAFSQIIGDYAYLVAVMPFLLVLVLFQMRKLG
jgi:Family of unknown function (DUF6328)